jgi:hypothetical protein
MLIKSYTPKVNLINLLPKEQANHPAYFGTREENIEFLETEGRLMMLTIMYEMLSNNNNKHLHDTYNPFSCTHSWPICNCQYAKSIRFHDLGFNNWNRFSVLMEVI